MFCISIIAAVLPLGELRGPSQLTSACMWPACAAQSCEDAGTLCRCVCLSDDCTLMGVCSHFQHVCLPQESLFQVSQAIKWSRAQISPVIRRDLEQKEKYKHDANSILRHQGTMFVGSQSRVWVGVAAHSLAEGSSRVNRGSAFLHHTDVG